MNFMKSLKSAIPRTMNVVTEGLHYNFQRDYGASAEKTWRTGVADSTWISKKYLHHHIRSSRPYFFPSMDGCAGIPFQNETNRVSPSKFFTASALGPLPLKGENIKKNFLSDSASLMNSTNCPLPSMSHVNSDRSLLDRKPKQQKEYEKTSAASLGINDEALFFSTNFVLFVLLFLVCLLARET